MQRVFLVLLAALLTFHPTAGAGSPWQPAERLDRGVVAFPTREGHVYVGWRLLANDPREIAFEVYRSETVSGPRKKISAKPITDSTNFVDETARGEKFFYSVSALVKGKVTEESDPVGVDELASVGGVRKIKLQGAYAAQKIGIGDLNGNGKLDFLIKQPDFNTDPYQMPGYWKPSIEPYKLEAYSHDGKFLWRHDMGWAIETGIWYSPVVVYDLDGDGKAEVYCKGGPPGDPRNPRGMVTSGPEYLLKLDGATGQVLAQMDWPDRSGMGRRESPDKPDYNYWSRSMLGIAYLDGKRPHLVILRGTYTLIKIRAYDPDLNLVWSRDTTGEYDAYKGSGTHGLQVADVDGDGRDELIIGAAAINDDGTPLWNTGRGHPDVCYVADIDPDRPGLEVFYGHEWRQSKNGVCVVDARTGETIWGYEGSTTHVHGQGMVADIDPTRPGMEVYGGERDGSKYWLYDAKGNRLSDQSFGKGDLSPRPVWWTDQTHKLIVSRGKMFEYNGPEYGEIRGRIIGIADVLGDWREELIVSVEGEIHIYSTTIPARSRRPCLLQDRQYRTAVAHQAMGYFYPPTLRGALFPPEQSAAPDTTSK
jgi:rhamnogalacturonan endolyase